MRSSILFLIGSVALLVATVAVAHHSTIDIYDDSQTVEITGVVNTWRFVNPHPFLVLDVPGPDGESVEWDVSFGGSAASALSRRGYSAETFKPGETVIVRGSPARAEGTHGLLVEGRGGAVTREDGSPIP